MKLPHISKPDEISNEDYHRSDKFLDYISSSSLKNYMISPKYARYTQLNPEEKKGEAMTYGSVYHDMLASITNTGGMKGFEQRWFVFEPPINPSTGGAYGYASKKYQEELAIQMLNNPGKQLCSEEDIKLAKVMMEELLQNNSESHVVRDFIKYGQAERSHFCEYQGQLFKFRTDIETKTKILDWKTVGQLEEAKEDEFSRTIIKRGYHISAAFYQFFDNIIKGKWRKFYWIVQEKIPPFDFIIHDASNWTWNIYKQDGEQIVEPKIGGLMFMKLMEQHIKCCEEKDWEGYSVFIQADWRKMRIARPEVPGWYENKMFDFFN